MFFVPKFKRRVDEISKKFVNNNLNVGRKCPQCGHQLVYRFSKITKKQFIGCSNYPKCNFICNSFEQLQKQSTPKNK